MIRRSHSQRIAVILLSCFIVLVLAGAGSPQSSRSADEAAIREADAQWSKAAGSLDVDKTVAFYSDDASVLPPNEPIANTKEAIRATWAALLAPGTAISWEPSKVEVAKSGDLAYLIGTYKLSMKGPDGKAMDDHGKMVEVWKKQPNKQWKCVADIFNSDVAMPSGEQK